MSWCLIATDSTRCDFTSIQLKETPTRKTITTDSRWHSDKICTWVVKWSGWAGNMLNVCGDFKELGSNLARVPFVVSSLFGFKLKTIWKHNVEGENCSKTKRTLFRRWNRISSYSVSVNFWVATEILIMRRVWICASLRAPDPEQRAKSFQWFRIKRL